MMTQEELASAQLGGMRDGLSSLLLRCLHRFLDAARLLDLGGPVIKNIEDASNKGGVNLTPLFPAWYLICERYRQERFDLQGRLFTHELDGTLERWNQFLHWELFPILISDNEFVRNILRVSLLVPCRSTEKAASAICHQISEMHRAFDTSPWDKPKTEGLLDT